MRYAHGRYQRWLVMFLVARAASLVYSSCQQQTLAPTKQNDGLRHPGNHRATEYRFDELPERGHRMSPLSVCQVHC